MTFPRALGYYDVTNITVGAIVGADIYIASAITAGMLGPASLLAWAVAGVLATVLALTLADCARMVPAVGGPYAYVTHAFGPFPGFLAGWSMWIAELTAMPVFAIAFTNYLGHFIALSDVATHAVRIGFLGVLTAVNVVSVRAAGRVNDALTALKLAPLVALVVGGLAWMVIHPSEAGGNLAPFAPFGFGEFPTALILIFWAFVGFELSTVPAGEVRDPERTIPRALATGMAIVTVFYLTTNFVVYGLVGHEALAGSRTPLVDAAVVVFGGAGATLMAVGAMISVSGSDESDMLGASRLGYAMAADGLLPHRLARVHPRFRTPHVALLAQGGLAVGLTFVDQIPDLISFAVVNLAFSFLLCAAALFRLHRTAEVRPSRVRATLPVAGAVIAVALLWAAGWHDRLLALLVLAVGCAVYAASAPNRPLPGAIAALQERERTLRRLARQRMRFLGGPIGWAGGHGSPRRRPRR